MFSQEIITYLSKISLSDGDLFFFNGDKKFSEWKQNIITIKHIYEKLLLCQNLEDYKQKIKILCNSYSKFPRIKILYKLKTETNHENCKKIIKLLIEKYCEIIKEAFQSHDIKLESKERNGITNVHYIFDHYELVCLPTFESSPRKYTFFSPKDLSKSFFPEKSHLANFKVLQNKIREFLQSNPSIPAAIEETDFFTFDKKLIVTTTNSLSSSEKNSYRDCPQDFSNVEEIISPDFTETELNNTMDHVQQPVVEDSPVYYTTFDNHAMSVELLNSSLANNASYQNFPQNFQRNEEEEAQGIAPLLQEREFSLEADRGCRQWRLVTKDSNYINQSLKAYRIIEFFNPGDMITSKIVQKKLDANPQYQISKKLVPYYLKKLEKEKILERISFIDVAQDVGGDVAQDVGREIECLDHQERMEDDKLSLRSNNNLNRWIIITKDFPQKRKNPLKKLLNYFDNGEEIDIKIVKKKITEINDNITLKNKLETPKMQSQISQHLHRLERSGILQKISQEQGSRDIILLYRKKSLPNNKIPSFTSEYKKFIYNSIPNQFSSLEKLKIPRYHGKTEEKHYIHTVLHVLVQRSLIEKACKLKKICSWKIKKEHKSKNEENFLETLRLMKEFFGDKKALDTVEIYEKLNKNSNSFTLPEVHLELTRLTHAGILDRIEDYSKKRKKEAENNESNPSSKRKKVEQNKEQRENDIATTEEPTDEAAAERRENLLATIFPFSEEFSPRLMSSEFWNWEEEFRDEYETAILETQQRNISAHSEVSETDELNPFNSSSSF